MYPTHWLYRLFGGDLRPGPRFCYLCGLNFAGEHTIEKGIADTFNSHYLARCPSSSWLCDACAWYLDRAAHPEHPVFTRMSLIVSPASWTNWQRETMKQDIAFWLEHGLVEDSYLVVSLSKKKHVLLQAPLSGAGSRQLAIQVEEQVAHCTHAAWQSIDEPFMSLLRLGHNKGEILSGQLYSNTLRKHGRIADALRYNDQLDEWRNSPLIEFYSYTTLIEKKDEDNAGESDRSHADPVPARDRDSAGGSGPAARRVERDRPRVPEQVSRGHLASVRGEDGGRGSDHEQLSLFPL